MSDTELQALTVLVSVEAAMFEAVNQQRAIEGYSMAYVDVPENWYLLRDELKRRRCLQDK